MATFNSSVGRADASSRLAREIPEKVVGGIIQDAETTSIALQLAQVHRMASFQERMRLQNARPDAYWINGTTSAGDAPHGSSNNDDTNQAAKDSGLKQTTTMDWENIYLRPDELAVMVVMPDAWRDDSDLAWEEIRKALRGAFARAIDTAVFFGASTTNHPLPSTFGEGLVPAALAEGNVVYLGDFDGTDTTGGYKNDRSDAYAQLAQNLAERGYDPSAFLVPAGEMWNLRRQRDSHGALLDPAGNLFNLPVQEVKNGTWRAADAIALAGDFSNLHIGIRQDMTFTLSNTAVIHNAAGTIQYNAWQQDGEVLRAVMRLGYVVTDPVKNLTGEREYPFTVLDPGTTPS